MMRNSRHIALIVGAAALVAGCGDDSSSGKADAPRENTETSEKRSGSAADERIARGGLLKLSDLPSGWTAADENEEAKQSQCAGVRRPTAHVAAKAESRRFETGSALAENSVYVYASRAQAEAAFAELSSQSTRRCVGEEFGRRIAEEGDEDLKLSGKITTSELQAGSAGSETAASRYTIPLDAGEDFDIDFIFDAVMVRAGRKVSIVSLADAITPVEDDLRERLTSVVAERLGA